MSTARRKSGSFCGKGPNGRNLCFCGCGREVERPRLNWFSDECVAKHQRINDPATIRRLVGERDKGICALCRIDTTLEQRIARDTEKLWYWLARREAERLLSLKELPAPYDNGREDKMAYSIGECHTWAWRWTEEQMKERGWSTERHTWEADHIVPVIEGGGQCDLDNYRTLCLPCHRRVTAELARRRAERRRAAKQAAVPQLNL